MTVKPSKVWHSDDKYELLCSCDRCPNTWTPRGQPYFKLADFEKAKNEYLKSGARCSMCHTRKWHIDLSGIRPEVLIAELKARYQALGYTPDFKYINPEGKTRTL